MVRYRNNLVKKMKKPDFNLLIKDFKQNKVPYYFVSATNFNLINLHQWVNNWSNINYINCFDGLSKATFIPDEIPHEVFNGVEDINEYLLNHEQTLEKIQQELIKAKEDTGEEKGHVIFLFFNQYLESLCESLNLQVDLPSNELVKEIDNKITTTEIGNEAKVYSVPNALAKVDSYQTLRELAEKHQLGNKWVIQTAFGDSGKTTFFISSEADYDRVAEKIEQEDKVKIMKQINCVGTAIEACATKQGTFVGPLLGELIGFEPLTPYKGGWCGNELYQENFSDAIRAVTHQQTERLGDALYKRGYRGYFEVDYLIDLDDGSIYLGEINPRITGISAMTNMSPFCQKTMPLFLFHLLEYADKEAPFTPAEYNALSLKEGAQGTSSQMIMKASHSDLRKVEKAPVSGVYELDDKGELRLVKASSEPTDKLDDPNKVYLMRIMDVDDYSWKGGDYAILFMNIQLTQAKGTKLNPNAEQWIKAVKSAFKTRELTEEEQELVDYYSMPSNIKGSEE